MTPPPNTRPRGTARPQSRLSCQRRHERGGRSQDVGCAGWSRALATGRQDQGRNNLEENDQREGGATQHADLREKSRPLRGTSFIRLTGRGADTRPQPPACDSRREREDEREERDQARQHGGLMSARLVNAEITDARTYKPRDRPAADREPQPGAAPGPER